MIFAVVLIFSLCGCSGEAVSLTKLPDPEEAVHEFFAHLENEEYDEADEMLYNYVSLGMVDSDRIDDAVMRVFYDELNSQRSYSIETAPVVTGKTAVMTIRVTTIDLRRVYDPLIVNVKNTIRRMQYEGEKVDTEEAVLAVASSELHKLLSEDKTLTTTGIFALELHYSEGHWKLSVSNELYSALIGYAV